jgi:hypothetical protein
VSLQIGGSSLKQHGLNAAPIQHILKRLIDGPARDRDYYVKKQLLGTDADCMADDDHLTKQHDRWPVALSSAFLQLSAYWDTGRAFCQDEACRLYNPHWQAELLGSMATDQLCEEHAAWLSSI